MSKLKQIFVRPISTESFDHKFSEIALYLCGLLFMVFGLLSLHKFSLSSGELLLAVLAIINITLLLMVWGSLSGSGRK